jgi:thymidine kinase
MNSGKIEIIFGPMFSGKTTELLRRINRRMFAKQKCLLIKYKFDNRYSDTEMATHDSLKINALSCTHLEEIKDAYKEYHVIGIDEGQFFPDIIEFSELYANEGKIVIIACLDGTFQRKPFGKILELIPLAEKVTKLSAVCVLCGKSGSFTQRIVANDQVELIGGTESYRPLCRACFLLKDKEVYQSPSKTKCDDKASTSSGEKSSTTP